METKKNACRKGAMILSQRNCLKVLLFTMSGQLFTLILEDIYHYHVIPYAVIEFAFSCTSPHELHLIILFAAKEFWNELYSFKRT